MRSVCRGSGACLLPVTGWPHSPGALCLNPGRPEPTVRELTTLPEDLP